MIRLVWRKPVQPSCPSCGEAVRPQMCGSCWTERNWKWLCANPKATR